MVRVRGGRYFLGLSKSNKRHVEIRNEICSYLLRVLFLSREELVLEFRVRDVVRPGLMSCSSSDKAVVCREI